MAEKLRNSGKILDNPNEEQSRKRIPEKMDIKQLKSEWKIVTENKIDDSELHFDLNL